MDDVLVGIEEESIHDDDEALTSIQNTITTKHHPPSDESNDKLLTNAHTPSVKDQLVYDSKLTNLEQYNMLNRRQEVDEGTNPDHQLDNNYALMRFCTRSQ